MPVPSDRRGKGIHASEAGGFGGAALRAVVEDDLADRIFMFCLRRLSPLRRRALARHTDQRGGSIRSPTVNRVFSMRRVVGVLVSGLVLAHGAAAGRSVDDTVSVSLRSALERALRVSPDLEAARAQVAFAEARRSEADASRFLTEFTATTGHSVLPGVTNPNGVPENELYLDPDVRNDWGRWSPYNQLEISALQPLYSFGEVSGYQQAARHGVDVEHASRETKELQVALRVGEMYYSLLLANELYDLAERTRDVVDRATEELEGLLDRGEADDADLFQLQITMQEFNQRVVEVAQNRLTARAALTRQLLLPEGTFVRTESSELRPLDHEVKELDFYMSAAAAYRPELAQARAGLAARSALVQVAHSMYYPKLFVGVSSNTRYTASRPRQRNPFIGNPYLGSGLVAGLGLRLQLNFPRTRARVAQAEAEREAVRAQLLGAEQLILFEVEKAYRDVVTAKAALEARDKALTLSKEWLRVEYINFDLDLGSTENLVKAVRENLELEARYFDAVFRHNMAVLRLLSAAGLLRQDAEIGTFVE